MLYISIQHHIINGFSNEISKATQQSTIIYMDYVNIVKIRQLYATTIIGI